MANLPVVGKVPKGWVIGVVVISGGILGYAYYKHKQNAAAAATATTASTAPAAGSTDPYPPDGTTGNPGDPNSTDPETGMTYGDEQLYGGAGGYGTTGYGGYGGYPGTGTTGGTLPGPGAFTTNADWASYAEAQLSGTVDPTALSAALGVYLTGRPATSDQVSLIDQAIAIAGYPPVAGPANQPPGINQSGGTTPPPPGGGSISGLKASGHGTSVSGSWQPVSGATSYTVAVFSHQHANYLGGGTTTSASYTVSGLPSKTDVSFHVTAQPGGQSGVTYTSTQ